MIPISIVIVTWNSKQVLADCVFSLFSHVPHGDFEIILVDNASANPAYLEDYRTKQNVVIVRNDENLGFSKAVNIGLRRACGDYFLVLNPDTVFVSNPFPRLLEELRKDPAIGVIGPLLYDAEGRAQIKDFYPALPSILQYIVYRSLLAIIPPFPWIARRFFHARVGNSGVYFVDQIPGAFLFFKRDLFGSEHAFNEDFFIWMEDVDFCLRVHRKGLKVAVVADEKVMHIGGTSFKAWEIPRRRLVFSGSYLTYLKMNAKPASFWIHTTLMILNSLLFLALSPIYYFRHDFNQLILRLGLEKKILGLVLEAQKSRLNSGHNLADQ